MAIAPSHTVPALPRHIQVEVTGACNLSCRMCLVRYQPKLGKKQGAMSFEDFARLMEELPDLEKVTLQGLGEPLLAPDLLDMVALVRARGAAVGFNSNATLLTRPIAERLVALGLSWLHVSLDGATAATYEGVRDGSDYVLVRDNLRGLLEARRAAGSADPRVLLVFVAMRRNIAELPELVRIAAEWGVDGLWVQNLSHSFSDTDPAGAYAEIRAFAAEEALWGEARVEQAARFAEARVEADRLGLELRLPELDEPRQERAPGAPGCSWPFEEAYVTHDGHAQPCCMVMGSDRARLGNVREEGFAAVWGNDAYAQFREQLAGDGPPPEVCQGCSLYRGVF